MTLAAKDGVSLLTPLYGENGSLKAQTFWDSHVEELQIQWKKNQEGKLDFSGSIVRIQGEKEKKREVTSSAAKLCQCHAKARREKWCQVEDEDSYAYFPRNCRDSCRTLWGESNDGCFAAFANDCDQLLLCVQGVPESQAPCDDGFMNIGASRKCLQICDAAHPCKSGKCTSYNGGKVCREEMPR
ncbi:MAG: hypothetical protein GY822_17940 [Deltaproteobacteria bacterium]|nr:hypothetical protein [Deltaproteobacteria bacterium]